MTAVALLMVLAACGGQAVVAPEAGEISLAQLEGEQVSGALYVLVAAPSNVQSVSFYMDVEPSDGEPFATDAAAPFTLDLDTTTLVDGSHDLTVAAYDGNGELATVMTATFVTDNGVADDGGDSGGAGDDSSDVGSGSVDVRIATGADDAEERGDGDVGLSSSDLELVTDKERQVVGMRFVDVDVPQGARITAAWIQFTTDETSTADTSLTLAAQAADDAQTFEATHANLSNRPTTSASVTWSPAAWTSRGASSDAQRTPDLSSLVQEIVSRDGWQAGNAVAVLVRGGGVRVAEAYDGEPNAAALLHVEFESADVPAEGEDPEEEPTNQAPHVDAGASAEITLGESVSLQGTVDDDGLPDGSVTTTWSENSGPGTVSFGDANRASTSATFSEAGSYVLRLTASDGDLAASDDVTISVVSAGDTDPEPEPEPVPDPDLETISYEGEYDSVFDTFDTPVHVDATNATFRTGTRDTAARFYGVRTLLGGTYDVAADLTSDWSAVKGLAGVALRYSPDVIVRDAHVATSGDAVSFGEDTPDWSLRDTYIGMALDDAIENDYLENGLIDSVLVDHAFHFLSARSGSDRIGETYTNGVVTVRNSLIRLAPSPAPDGDQKIGGLWKMQKTKYTGEGTGNQLALHDNIILVEAGAEYNRPELDPSDNDEYRQDALLEASGNVIVWLGEGEYPARIPPGFTVTTDRSVWDDARDAWFDAHPSMNSFR